MDHGCLSILRRLHSLSLAAFQIQGQVSEGASSALHRRAHYRGMFHALSTIAREEGVRALYFGIKPAVFRQATYGTIKFGIYYRLKSIVMGAGESSVFLFFDSFMNAPMSKMCF